MSEEEYHEQTTRHPSGSEPGASTDQPRTKYKARMVVQGDIDPTMDSEGKGVAADEDEAASDVEYIQIGHKHHNGHTLAQMLSDPRARLQKDGKVNLGGKVHFHEDSCHIVRRDLKNGYGDFKPISRYDMNGVDRLTRIPWCQECNPALKHFPKQVRSYRVSPTEAKTLLRQGKVAD